MEVYINIYIYIYISLHYSYNRSMKVMFDANVILICLVEYYKILLKNYINTRRVPNKLNTQNYIGINTFAICNIDRCKN
jgi:hypothetical protein